MTQAPKGLTSLEKIHAAYEMAILSELDRLNISPEDPQLNIDYLSLITGQAISMDISPDELRLHRFSSDLKAAMPDNEGDLHVCDVERHFNLSVIDALAWCLEGQVAEGKESYQVQMQLMGAGGFQAVSQYLIQEAHAFMIEDVRDVVLIVYPPTASQPFYRVGVNNYESDELLRDLEGIMAKLEL